MLLCFALHSPALLHFFTPLQTVVWLGHSPKSNVCLLTALFKVESWETNCPNSGNQIQARHLVKQALRPVTTHLATQGLEIAHNQLWACPHTKVYLHDLIRDKKALKVRGERAEG